MLTIRGAEFLPSSLCYLLDKSCNCPALFILLDMQTLARHEDVSIVRKNLATLLLCRHARCFVFRQGAESAAGGSWMWRVRVLFSAVCSVCCGVVICAGTSVAHAALSLAGAAQQHPAHLRVAAF